jgi:hypothetical protein
MPEVLAMILCDQVIRDQMTGKVSIIGSFSKINAEKFPAVHPRMAVYIALTDGEGDYQGALRFVFDETGHELFRGDFPVRLPNPLGVAEIHFAMPAISLPKPGKYHLDLLCDGELLKSRWFLAHQATRKGGKP